MTHLWVSADAHGGRSLHMAQLEGDSFVLTGDVAAPVRCKREQEDAGDAEALIIRDGVQGKGIWLLMARAGSEIRVNGRPLLAGLRVLRDRDEIRIGSHSRLFFSTEALAQIASFPGGERPTFCPRCKQEIDKGTPAVRCPNPRCGAYHHQSDELPCWTYAPCCSLCDQPTELNAGYRWTPEEL